MDLELVVGTPCRVARCVVFVESVYVISRAGGGAGLLICGLGPGACVRAVS